MATSHVHYGAGLFGCLYQDGPHWAETYEEAVQALTSEYSLGTLRKRQLRQDGYLQLSLKRDGNEYCEISGPCEGGCDPVDYE